MKKTKKKILKPKLSELQKNRFFNQAYCYFVWVAHNDDLVDPYVLDVEQKYEKQKIKKTIKQPKKPRFINKKSLIKLKRIGTWSLLIILTSIVVQILYPRGRSMPFARLDSYGHLGFADSQQILGAFNDFDQRIVTVHTHSKDITTGYKDLGVQIDPELVVNKMTNYPIGMRLVPFSILFYGNKTYYSERTINQSQLDQFVRDVVALASKNPVDALVNLDNEKFKVTTSQEGYAYKSSALKSAVLGSSLANKAQIVFTPTILYPNITSAEASQKASIMQQRIGNSIQINADGKTMNIDKNILKNWVLITNRPDNKTIDIVFDKSKVIDSIKPLISMVNYQPTNSVTTILNGNSVGRNEGASGRSLDFYKLVQSVQDLASSPATGSIEANVRTLPSPEVIDRKYTKDNLGIQSLINYWSSSHSKAQYSVGFRTLNGRIEANLNPNRLFPAVGFHKVYIAGLIYNRVHAGSINMNSLITSDQTVAICLDKMVVNSEETCTNLLGNIIGWSASDTLLSSQGLNSTTLTQGASLTTVNDSVEWLDKLNHGAITTFADANSIKTLMSRQALRTGIPAGSLGIRVDNKSGSYGRIVNDMAIVYHPGGNYILSVMSEGGSYAQIAELAKEINKVMSQ